MFVGDKPGNPHWTFFAFWTYFPRIKIIQKWKENKVWTSQILTKIENETDKLFLKQEDIYGHYSENNIEWQNCCFYIWQTINPSPRDTWLNSSILSSMEDIGTG